MKPGEKITIERVGNGFIVMPACAPHDATPATFFYVFQRLGETSIREDPESLLDFIEQHFDQERTMVTRATSPGQVVP